MCFLGKNSDHDALHAVCLSAGVNRHFHMICIRDKFSQNIGRQVSSSVIWDHLGTMYDMQALVRTHTYMLSVCYMLNVVITTETVIYL